MRLIGNLPPSGWRIQPSIQVVQLLACDGAHFVTRMVACGQRHQVIQRNVVDDVALYDLMALAASDHASDEVRAIASQELHDLYAWLNAPAGGRQIADQAHVSFALRQIEQFEKDPKKIDLTAPAEPPDGPPIGTDEDWDWQE